MKKGTQFLLLVCLCYDSVFGIAGFGETAFRKELTWK